MKKDDTVYLRHILDAIERIQEYVGDVSKTAFLQHHMLQDAVVRQIEIVGEAARNVSGAYQESHPEVPWANMTGMRNKVIHDYFDVNFDVVWDTVMSDLPALKAQVQGLLGE